MKLYLDPNGWVIHVLNFDPRQPSEEELDYLRTLPFTNVLVVMHDLPVLTAQEYQDFCRRVYVRVQNDNPTKDKRFLPGSNREVMRVTGRLDEEGEMIGLFGMPEFLPWHCNQPAMPLDQRPDCLTLYSVEGSAGSITAYSNSSRALRDLRQSQHAPPGLLENLDRIEVFYNYSVDLDRLSDSNQDYEGPSGKNTLVVKNKAGIPAILLSNLVTKSFWINDQELNEQIYKTWLDYLCKFLTQKKYVYAHRWRDNEMTFNCQVSGQHARLPFARIEQRLLWRVMGVVTPFDGALRTDFPLYNP